jgi:hypothetical protein
MDTLYYSNFCKHSQQVLQFLVKGNLTDQLNFICIDKRVVDPKDRQTYIVMENGKRTPMPPNIQRVPTLLITREKYRPVLGEDIIKYFHPAVEKKMQSIPNYQGEPVGIGDSFTFSGSSGVLSEPYTLYNLTPDELSAKGEGARRPMYHYVSANYGALTIPTPPETYQPDKIGGNITVDKLQQQRMDDVRGK